MDSEMKHKEHFFECVSFWELLQRCKIEIPIIQRDYAQGREEQEKVRTRFLEALKDAVTSDPLELDFVYGDLVSGVFKPLDGQQRLTTLFLLHWYASRKADLDPRSYRTTLAGFTYETRVSSRDFCKGLVCETFDVDWEGARGAVSLSIKDCPWFVASWGKDPTVDGMLRMLDAIHVRFRDVSDLWSKLTHETSPSIRLNFINLPDFGLSDDLYIKMNARGKPLTSFENFKALFEKRIEEAGWDIERELRDRFRIKIDTTWTDQFWSICPTDDSGGRSIDSRILRFCIQSLVCSVAGSSLTRGEKEAFIKKLLVDSYELVSNDFDEFEYEELYVNLDMIQRYRELPHLAELSYWDLVDDPSKILRELVESHGPLYQKRVLLHAQFHYLTCVAMPDSGKYSDWCRVIRNIVKNVLIDSPERFVGAINLVNELATGALDIYDYLTGAKIKSGFADSQVKEEQRKGRIIEQRPEVRSLIHKLEDCSFCEGRISFALDCAPGGVSESGLDTAKLERVSDVLGGVLSKVVEDNCFATLCKIRRVLLTVGDGKHYTYWKSWLYVVESPKYCLIESASQLRHYAYFADHCHYLKGLVEILLDKTLDEAIESWAPPDITPNWKVRLVREPELVEFSKKGYIAINEDEEVCYLIRNTRVANSDEGRSRLEEVY